MGRRNRPSRHLRVRCCRLRALLVRFRAQPWHHQQHRPCPHSACLDRVELPVPGRARPEFCEIVKCNILAIVCKEFVIVVHTEALAPTSETDRRTRSCADGSRDPGGEMYAHNGSASPSGSATDALYSAAQYSTPSLLIIYSSPRLCAGLESPSTTRQRIGHCARRAARPVSHATSHPHTHLLCACDQCHRGDGLQASNEVASPMGPHLASALQRSSAAWLVRHH